MNVSKFHLRCWTMNEGSEANATLLINCARFCSNSGEECFAIWKAQRRLTRTSTQHE